jgi:16S rRNA (guanine527-N7)-methyltransferase
VAAGSELESILAEAQGLGWIGPGDLAPHLDHAHGFADVLGDGPGRVVDLGSGGGLPALPVALARPAWTWLLVDAQARRAAFLERAVTRLGLAARVTVRHQRAEEIGRDPAWRGQADAVTARSFASPAVVAECGAPLLRVGGRLLVSDPPEGAGDRWPDEGLAGLGLVEGRRPTQGAQLTVLLQAKLCPGRYPRRPGIPQKRPLF